MWTPTITTSTVNVTVKGEENAVVTVTVLIGLKWRIPTVDMEAITGSVFLSDVDPHSH
jgi:hypothetical protein